MSRVLRLILLLAGLATVTVAIPVARGQANPKAIGVEPVVRPIPTTTSTPPPPPAFPSAQNYLTGPRYALVIGIDDYADPRITDLTTSQNDAKSIYELLTNPSIGAVPTTNATLLLGRQATFLNIRKALNRLRRVPSSATVFVYYSGHGAREADDAYWVTQDTELGDLAATGLADQDVRGFLGRVPSDRMVVMVDCCYAAATVQGVKSAGETDELASLLQRFTGKGRAYLMAAGSRDTAIEAADLKRSVFTHYLAQGLAGQADANHDGVVVLTELIRYVDQHVSEQARIRGGVQKPVVMLDDVQQPSRFHVTVNLPRIREHLNQQSRAQRMTDRRLKVLWRLYLDELITRDHYQLGKRLLTAVPEHLDSDDHLRLEQFIAVTHGKLQADKLQRALDAIEPSPAVDQANPNHGSVTSTRTQRRVDDHRAHTREPHVLPPHEIRKRIDEQFEKVRAGQDATHSLPAQRHSQAKQSSSHDHTDVQCRPDRREEITDGALRTPGWWLSQAQSSAAQIQLFESRASTQCLITLVHARSGDVPAAKATVQGIQGVGHQSWALGEIAAAQARSGDWQAAQSTTQAIRFPHWRPFAYRHVAVAQAKAGDVDGAYQLIDQIREFRERALAHAQIALWRSQRGDVRAATKAFRRALVDAAEIQDIGSRVETYSRIAMAQAKAGAYPQACETFAQARQQANRIRYPQAQVMVLSQLATVIANTGDTTSACKAFAQAAKAVATIACPQGRALAFGQLAQNQARCGLIDSAHLSIRAARQVGALLNDGTPLGQQVLGEIAIAYALAGQPSNAQVMMAKIHDRVMKADVHREIARAWARKGDLSKLLSGIALLDDAQQQAYAYLGAAEGLLWEDDAGTAFY